MRILKISFLKTILLLCLSLVICAVLAACGKVKTPDYAVLVNKEHPISEDYVDTIELVEVDDVWGTKVQIEKKTAEAFFDLQEDLKENGLEVIVDDAYRSIEAQQETMDRFTRKYGKEYAQQNVAVPGTSEHHTGLAIDIVPKVNGKVLEENEDMMKETEFFARVHEFLPKYGFILRYPEGKEEITGFAYEPWHFRYVGTELAQKLYNEGLTLEEYYDGPTASIME